MTDDNKKLIEDIISAMRSTQKSILHYELSIMNDNGLDNSFVKEELLKYDGWKFDLYMKIRELNKQLDSM